MVPALAVVTSCTASPTVTTEAAVRMDWALPRVVLAALPVLLPRTVGVRTLMVMGS